jgi:hypothetical protein
VKVLYFCADLGIPVLGRRGASIHVRVLAAALDAQGTRRVTAIAGEPMAAGAG